MPLLTGEQILQARSVDLLDYLQAYEPSNVRKSKGSAAEHYMVEHDSLKMSNGKWFRHSTQMGGCSALDFLMKVRGIHFVDAVKSLTDGYVFTNYRAVTNPKASVSEAQSKPPKPFVLPKPNRNNDLVVAYLRGRGIERDVIYRCIEAGILYESDKHRGVFVGKDENGKARFACERGITDDWKKDVFGSNKQYSFFLPPQNPNGHGNSALALFESPTDSLAHASIHDLGQTDRDGYRLSLGGVSSIALHGFLERNRQITDIRLCLDNDTAGHDATNRIIKELLSDRRYADMKITVTPPPIGKDYADTAKAMQLQLNNKRTKPINRPGCMVEQ